MTARYGAADGAGPNVPSLHLSTLSDNTATWYGEPNLATYALDAVETYDTVVGQNLYGAPSDFNARRR